MYRPSSSWSKQMFCNSSVLISSSLRPICLYFAGKVSSKSYKLFSLFDQWTSWQNTDKQSQQNKKSHKVVLTKCCEIWGIPILWARQVTDRPQLAQTKCQPNKRHDVIDKTMNANFKLSHFIAGEHLALTCWGNIFINTGQKKII